MAKMVMMMKMNYEWSEVKLKKIDKYDAGGVNRKLISERGVWQAKLAFLQFFQISEIFIMDIPKQIPLDMHNTV